LKCYTARKMTGVPGRQLVAQALRVKAALEAHGIIVLDPVISEKVKRTYRPLHNSFSKLKEYWFRDKRMIQQAHVVLDLTAPEKSEGVSHELGYARYFCGNRWCGFIPTSAPLSRVLKMILLRGVWTKPPT
jgi:hypothetical protein